MGKTIKIIKPKEKGIKIGLILKRDLGRDFVVNKLSSPKSATKITFYDTPQFDLLKNKVFLICKKYGRKAIFYSISERRKIPFSKDENFFSKFFPFLEISAKVEKVRISSKLSSYEATFFKDVALSNPISKKEENFPEFLVAESKKQEEMSAPFCDLVSFFKEQLYDHFWKLKIPFILNEEKLNLKIDENEPVSSALLKSIRKIAYKIEGFRYGVLKDLHPEYVHEMRVCFRKTRSYLNTFPEVLGPKRAKSLSISASSFAFDLGALRDLDVFISHLKEFLKEIDSRGKDAEILRIFQEKRNEETELVQRIFQSSKFDKFLIRLFNFSKPKETSNVLGRKPFPESGFEKLSVLKSTIKRRMKKYKKSLSADRLHRVRISFKKFRYLFEIIRPFFGKNSKKMKEKLSEIQGCLGFHQDLQIAQKLIEEATNSSDDKDTILVFGALLQLINRKEKKEIKKFDKLYREFERFSIPSFQRGEKNESGGSWSRKGRKRNSKRSSFRQKPTGRGV